MERRRWTAWSVSLMAAVLLAGCARPVDKSPQAKAKESTSKEAATETTKEDHHGWWCKEHGIPEAECSMCSDKVAAEFKKKGDWCDKHDRAQSQCFICDPSLKEKFAARYRTKYGKEPPPIEEETPKGDEKKGTPKPEK